MDRYALRTAAVRYGLMLLLSVVLVAGFWFHSAFYSLGFVPLLLVGGLATFLVVLAFRAAGSGVVWGRAQGRLSLSQEVAVRVLAGTQTRLLFPVETELPRAQSSAAIHVQGNDRPLGRVRVLDLHRRLAGDLGDADVRDAGFDGLDGFRLRWDGGGSWDPLQILTVVDVRREGQ